MKAAVEHHFNGPTGSLTSYTSSLTSLGTLLRQASGSNVEDNFISTAPSSMVNISEVFSSGIQQIPYVYKWSNDTYWIFTAPVANTGTTRAIALSEFNSTSKTITYKGLPKLQKLGKTKVGKFAKGAAEVASKAVTKESFDFLFESEAQTLGPVDITKPSKHTSGLWDQIKKMALPVVGSLLISALAHFFPMVTIILEVILVTIGVFELLGAVCKIDKIKSKMPKVCSIQHNIHHFLEAKSGGGH